MSFIAPNQVYTYFSSNFSIKKTSKGWHTFKCPMCNELEHRKKMAVHFTYRTVKCWVCGYQEHVIDFVADVEGVSCNDARNILRECKPSSVDLEFIDTDRSTKVFSEMKMPFGFNSLLDGNGSLGTRARAYLKGRGFNLKELDRMGVGYVSKSPPEGSEQEDYFGYIIIPFKVRGKLIYFIGRDFIGNFLRYKNPPKGEFDIGKGDVFFNEDALFLYDEVFVLEGWTDAYTIGRQAVASLGWKLSTTQMSKILKSEADIITLVPDAGADGNGVLFYLHALKLALDLMPHKQVRVVDLNSMEGGKDVNEIGKEAFMEQYRKSPIRNEQETMLEFLNYEC